MPSARRPTLLGVTEDEPVDFFIYADQDSFYDALGPGTRENVGGQANADIRTLFALISPSAHRRPVGRRGRPPRARPPRLRHRRREPVPLPAALAQRRPRDVPERGLRGRATATRRGGRGATAGSSRSMAWPASSRRPHDGFFLAYAESVSAVDFLIRTHGQDALIELIDVVRRRPHRRRGVRARPSARTSAAFDVSLAGRPRVPSAPVRRRTAAGSARTVPAAWGGTAPAPAPTGDPAGHGAGRDARPRDG